MSYVVSVVSKSLVSVQVLLNYLVASSARGVVFVWRYSIINA